MKNTITLALLTGALFAATALLTAQDQKSESKDSASPEAAADTPEMPQPQKEHQWLQDLAGEWEYETEITMDPAQPPMKTEGKETVRKVGGFWIVSEMTGDFQGATFTGLLTLGYDPAKGKYVGNWVDSMNSYMWTYEGEVSEDGKTLTLMTEGPCHLNGGKISQFREVLEIKGPDHKVFTSSVKLDEGGWTQFVVSESHRKS